MLQRWGAAHQNVGLSVEYICPFRLYGANEDEGHFWETILMAVPISGAGAPRPDLLIAFTTCRKFGKLPISIALNLISFKGVVLLDVLGLVILVVSLLLCWQYFVESNLLFCP